jgi:phage protein D
VTTIANVPDWRVTLDGKDLTDELRPRLISLRLTEKRGDEADQLDIAIDDSDGLMAIPRLGVILTVKLGWKAGSDVETGLIDKGRFKVDAVDHGGAPDALTIRASSADFTAGLKIRREKSWHDTTIGAIVSDVAGRNKLKPRCAGKLSGIAVKTFAQSRESDMALLRRLGREHDAIATVKAGCLLFSPIGAGVTPSGAAIPSATVRRRDGDGHRYSVEKREEHTGVTASWHDRKGAKRETVTVGDASNAKRLSRVYGSAAEARRAATAEQGRIGRDPTKFSMTLALGRADLYPDQRVTPSGFKAEIDAQSWLLVEVSHTLDNRGGFTTSIQCEGG